MTEKYFAQERCRHGVPRHGMTLRAAFWPFWVFALVALVVLRGITDPDVWTHLTIGREVMRLGRVPATEFYVATLSGLPGHFNEWGYGVLLFLTHQAGGLLALALLNAAIAAAVFTLLFDILRQRLGNDPWRALALVLFGVWFADFRLNFRPEMLTYLAVFASLWGIERYRGDPHLRWLLPMLVAGLILPQFHPSILVVLIVVGAHSIEYLRHPKTRQRFGILAAAAVVTTVVAGLNPYGFEQVILPIKFALDAPLMSGIIELLPALATEIGPRFAIMAGLAAIAIAITRRQTRLGDVLVIVFFGWLAFRHARNVALFGLLTLPAVASALGMLRWEALRRWPSSLAALTLLTVAGLAVKQPQWGGGVDLRNTPVQAAKLLAKIDLDGPILAFFHLGNYIAWSQYPRAQVIADARHFGFNEALRVHDLLFSAPPDWENALRARRVSAVVTPMTMAFSGEFVPLAVALLSSSNWQLVAAEEAGLTFLPRGSYSGPALAPSAAWDQATYELNLNLKDYPDSVATRESLKVAQLARLRTP